MTKHHQYKYKYVCDGSDCDEYDRSMSDDHPDDWSSVTVSYRYKEPKIYHFCEECTAKWRWTTQ